MPSIRIDRDENPLPAQPFEALGLHRSSYLVYRALLERPDLDLDGLGRHLGLDSSTVEDALDALADMALLDHGSGSAGDWVPVDPDMRLSAILAAEEAEVHHRWESVRQAKRHIAELAAVYRKAGHSGTLPNVEHVVGLDEVRQRLERLAAETCSEVATLVPGGPQSKDVLQASHDLDSETLARGVQMRTVYVESIRNSQETMGYARWMLSSGADIRTATTLPMRLIVADRSLAVIPVDPDDPRQGALIIRHRGVVSVCLALFEQVWRSASVLKGTADPLDAPVSEASAQEVELLRLLGQGHSDDFVARQLGVSLRTVRRMMAALMRRLGAKSRFQAGMTATSLGWLEPSPESLGRGTTAGPAEGPS
ncbi:helix-turn-helix transcriptional regulator [Kitasatospora azatica]|uniref:helix-turn-helix transcriptional regulator n=1 Tax=Kitasatospora azatica TaxID=58347 RepID=UPI00068B16FE|nr:helix-turn-helix transcriptional regulator [Kitasatospora azatica]